MNNTKPAAQSIQQQRGIASTILDFVHYFGEREPVRTPRDALRQSTAIRAAFTSTDWHAVDMASVLEGFVVKVGSRLPSSVEGALLIPLASGFAFAPLTASLKRSMVDGEGDLVAVEPFGEFYNLTSSAVRWAVDTSRTLPLFYFLLEFHGGTGFQEAVGWVDGQLAFGPVFTADEPEDHRFEVLGRDQWAEGAAINRALQWLGMPFNAGGDPDADAFARAGLTRFKWTEEWTNSSDGS